MFIETMYKVLMVVIAVDLFAVGVLLIFLFNSRMNLKRQIIEQRFYIRAYYLATTLDSSDTAAEMMGIPREVFLTFCKNRNIEIPEDRIERLEQERLEQEQQEQRIMAEEAAWRAEQERLMEERRKSQEEEARKRMEKLKKFGFT
ncbi:MAG: hypothetical protein J7M24_08545 [Candidatus Latescibacteria bacterium]|nr:hypothetical protein [Candidatus Latescibacterota bacterium]